MEPSAEGMPASQPPPQVTPISSGLAQRAWARDVYMAAIIVAVFVLDQVTKQLVRDHLVVGASVPAQGFFRISHVANTGSAFGLFPQQTLLLIVASLVGIGVLLVFYRTQALSGVVVRTSLGLELGGAAGNLADRLTQGWVTDFLDVGPWPVFNLADASIVVGIGVLAWMLLGPAGQSGKGRAARQAPEAPPGPLVGP